jgi:hypothetical protein
MIPDQRRMEWRVVALSIAGFVVVAGLALGGLAGGAGTGAYSAPRPRFEIRERALPAHLASVDEALARRDVTRAVVEWRDAYGVALRSRQWESMVAVGDAAVRIDAATSRPAGHPSAFRAEARQAYLRALFDARAAGSREGVQRVAAAYAAIGDAEMATMVRTMASERR